MSGNIWITLGIIAGAFSLFALPYGFHLKNLNSKKVVPKQITEKGEIKTTSRYAWEIINDFRGPSTIAIWVKPRHDEINNYRFFFPSDVKCIDFGHGIPNKKGFTGMKKNTLDHISDTLNINNKRIPVYVVGSSDDVSSSLGCYIVFGVPFPSFVGFAYEQFNVKGSINRNLEVININL